MSELVKKIIKETVLKPKSPDEQRFVDKHIVDKIDYPVAQPAKKDVQQAKRDADLADGEDEEVYEEMTPAQTKKREEIVKSMKDKTADFKKRYGDKWKEVMYATATKQAVSEEIDLSEGVSENLKLRSGETVNVPREDRDTLDKLFQSLNPENRKKMTAIMLGDKKGYSQILNFAKEATK